MSDKDWCDTEEFATAWLVAIALHGCHVEGGKQAIREALSRAEFRNPEGRGA